MTDTTTAAPDLVRRPFLAEPGESLLLPEDLVELQIRFTRFTTHCGYPSEATVLTPMVSVPLPPPGAAPRGSNLSPAPAFLWHPLAWLPPRLSTLRVAGDRPEPLDLWGLRVALEMQESGLYDISTGTWADLAALLDIDIDDPQDLARLTAWAGGSTDKPLDTLDLQEVLHVPSDPDWATEMAADLLEDFRSIAAARTARNLSDVARGALEATSQDGLAFAEDPSKRRALVVMAANSAHTLLARQLRETNHDLAALAEEVSHQSLRELDLPYGAAYRVIDVLEQVEREHAGIEAEYLDHFDDTTDTGTPTGTGQSEPISS